MRHLLLPIVKSHQISASLKTASQYCSNLGYNLGCLDDIGSCTISGVMWSYMSISFWASRNSKEIVSYKMKLQEQAQYEAGEAALFPFPIFHSLLFFFFIPSTPSA